MVNCFEYEIEQKIIGLFDNEVKSPTFEDAFKISLDNNSIISYNLKEKNKEYDIIIEGEKRLSIGLLINDSYNIEIETRRCNIHTIEDKCEDGMLFSVILTNGESNNARYSKMPYSFIDFKENFNLTNFDFKTQELPSLKKNIYNSSNPFTSIKKEYAFVPKIVNNNCEKIKSLIEERNIVHLENILKSLIVPNLKRGLLYFLCDNLVSKKIKNLDFIPELMQVSFIDNNGLNNCLIDSSINRRKIADYSVSKSYEKYLTKKHNKKIAKALNSKNFSLITEDEELFKSCNCSEIKKAYLIKGNILELGLKDYIKEIKIL
jgi:hypothetical protein